MLTVENFSDLQRALRSLTAPLGFVPTMGYLHEGHLSLVRRAREECSSVVVSIFTNPTQFAPEEDLENYPRDIDRDLKFLSLEKTDLVWIPTVEIMYPKGYQTWVTVEKVTQSLEGRYRPTHFRGVSTVVSKLFNAVQPQKAYFGQKDAQQAVVIQQMVRDLNYPLKIIVCPTVREPDGLAMSSRNSYLNEDERRAARCLSRGLEEAREAFYRGENHANHLREIVSQEVKREKLAALQYISCADPETLEELEGKVSRCLLSMAVFIGETRLIDNIVLTEPS